MSFIPPQQRAQLEPVILEHQQEVLALDQYLDELDQQLQMDRQAMIHEFNTTYNQHPDHFRNLIHDIEWLTLDVYQDLQLSAEVVHSVQQALSPPMPDPNYTINQQINEMRQ